MEYVICSDGIKREWNAPANPIVIEMNGCSFQFGNVTCPEHEQGVVCGYRNCTDNTFVERDKPFFSIQDDGGSKNVAGVPIKSLFKAIHLKGVLDGQAHPKIHPELLHHNSEYNRMVNQTRDEEIEYTHVRVCCAGCGVELCSAPVVPRFRRYGMRVCTQCLFKEQQLELNHEEN